MDAEVVAQLMISQQLLSKDVIMTAQSLYNKERIQYTDVPTLVSFCETLKANNNQRKIGETLLNGK